MLLNGVRMTEIAWKWLEIVGKGCIRALYGSNWLLCLKMARNGWKWIGNWWKWMEIARNGMTRKCFVKYHSHVQSYVSAALAWKMPLRISAHGIPFPNWDVMLSRHQLGATSDITVAWGACSSISSNAGRQGPVWQKCTLWWIKRL